MKQFIVALVLTGVTTLSVLHAQEQLGSSTAVSVPKGPGWTLTPTIGVGETYDSNVSLFPEGTTTPTDDYVSVIFPSADLSYGGRHTRLDLGYSGSFLDYRTFTVLDRWNQRAWLDLRREESARLSWFAIANASALPSTDLVDLGGIPYRHEGVKEYDARGGFSYLPSARQTIATSLSYQDVTFLHSETLQPFLHGGDIAESLTTYRYRLSERLSGGADYSFRWASTFGEPEQFDIQTVEAAIDYQISAPWSLSAGAGFVHLQATPLSAARTGPALRVSVERHGEVATFHVSYLRSYIPAFGLGGTSQDQEIGAGIRAPLFHSRHFYTEDSLIFRDDVPLTPLFDQLPLRSLISYSVIGWSPQTWLRFEGFYARSQQSSLRPGGLVDRNRVGFQIVTSKPMRIQ